jgi:hypothetical protein
MGSQGLEYYSTAAPALRTAVAYLPRVEGRCGENDWYFTFLSDDGIRLMKAEHNIQLAEAAER